MTNKKLKLAAMSVALTACVAAQPLAANAADDPGEAQNPTAKVTEGENANANGSTEGGENANANGSTEGGEKAHTNGGTEGGTEGGENPNANGGEETTGKDETGKKTETPAGVNQQGKNPEDLLGDKDVNYDHENPPTTNKDGSTTIEGTVTDPSRKDDTPTGGTTGSGTETGSTGTDQGPTEQGPTDQGPTEIQPTEKDPSQIGTVDKTEKDNKDTTTEKNPKENAKPEVDPNKSSSSETKEDGTIVISTPTRVPATEETTSTGSGEANAKLNEVEKPKQDFSEDQEKLKEELQKELGDTLPGWETGVGDPFGTSEKEEERYHVEKVSESADGNSKDLTLKKTTETPTDMTAEDIAKLLEAEATTPDENGNYTLTRDKVEGVDENGRKFTRITYITVVPGTGKVTTHTETTLVVTVEKGTQTVDKEFTEEEKDYTKSDNWNKETILEDEKGNKYTVNLQELLKDKTAEEIKSAMASEGSFTIDGGDGVTYEVTFGKEDDGTQLDLSPYELAAMLNTDYWYDKDTDTLYYIGEGSENKTEVTPDKTKALLKSLSVTVKVTNTKGHITDTGSNIIGDKTEADATAEAKLNAIKNALKIAAEKENLTLTDTDLANVSADEILWTYIDPKTGTKYTFLYTLCDDFKNHPEDITASVSKEEKDKLDGDEINKVWNNTVSGTAFVAGATITSTGESQTYTSGSLGDLTGDFRIAPDGATEVKREGNSENGRIISYVKDGKTYTFTYTPLKFENLDPKLQDELREKAKNDGLTLKEVTADLTKVDWTIFTGAKEEKHEETITNADPISVLPESSWSQSDVKSNGKYDFTYKGGSAEDMDLTSTVTDEDGVKTETFTKTDENGTVTTITVTTRRMGESELREKFDGKFGEGSYDLNTTDHTVTYTEGDKTYTARYDDSVQTMNVETKAPQEAAGTGNSEQAAIDNFMVNLEKARKEAALAGEELILELPDGQKLTITEETKWEEIKTHVKHVVNFKAMSDADLVNYLTKLRDDAVSSKTSYTGDYGSHTLYYFDEDGKSYHVSDTQKDEQGNIKKVLVDGQWKDVTYEWVGWGHWGYYEPTNIKKGPNYIGHLDLATDSKLQDEDGGRLYDDCVLTEKTLEWNKNANDLVNKPNSNHKVGLLDRITYDNENDNDPETGHYEYPRASWDGASERLNHAPDESAYYKVTGKVSYGKCGDAFEATATGRDWRGNTYYTEEDYARAKAAADAALDAYKKAHADDGLDLSKAKVVEIYKNQSKNGERYYQIYLYESNLTAYGYLSDSSNTCGNAHYNAQDRSEYVGGFDLTLGNLTQVSKEEIVAVGKKTFNCSATLTRIKKTLDQANKDLTYTNQKVKYTTTTGATSEDHTGMTGSYQATDTQVKNYGGDNAAIATGTDNYYSYDYTNYDTTTGETTTTVTRKDGFVHFIYRTIKDAFVSKASKTETEKKSANVKYTYTTVETRDSYLPGDDQITIITPEDPEEPKTPDDDGPVTPEQPELPPVQDATPDEVVEPETPVLPPVQDATPDAVILPAAPELPPVQDATVSALPQTGVNWLTAFGMACSGFALMVVGAFTSLKYKEKH